MKHAKDQVRAAYWIAVTNWLAEHGWRTEDRNYLDHATIESLALWRGLVRKNIPDPANMALAVSRLFTPWE